MRKILLLAAFPLMAQTAPPANVQMQNGQPRAVTPVAIVDSTGASVSPATRTTAAGTSDTQAVPVQGVTGGVPQNVQGPSASGSAVSGNPLRMGYSDGTLTRDVLGTTDGSPYFQIKGTGNAAGVATVGNAATPMVTSVQALRVASAGQVYNGTAFVLAAGDTTGSYMVGKGGSSLATGQVSVATTSTLLVAARSGRQKVTLSVGTANTCAFGNTGVTTTTGFPLQPVAGASITIDTAAAVYAACSATTTVSYLEQF